MCIILPYSSKVGQSIQRRKWRHFLNNPSIILHDNARCIQQELWLIYWLAGAGNCFTTPRYSPDLSPCDYDLIPKMKEPLRGTCFHTIHEVLQVTDHSLHNIQRLGNANHIQWLPHHWKRVIHNSGGYIEGLWNLKLVCM